MHRFVKPQQAPPIPSSRHTIVPAPSSSLPTKQDKSQGLILLSTKKSKLLSHNKTTDNAETTNSATTTTTTTNTTTTSSSTKQLPSHRQLHLHAEAPSTHDQLMNAIGVKTHGIEHPNEPYVPDAWGTISHKKEDGSAEEHYVTEPVSQSEENLPTPDSPPPSPSSNAGVVVPNWEEYGGRDLPSPTRDGAAVSSRGTTSHRSLWGEDTGPAQGFRHNANPSQRMGAVADSQPSSNDTSYREIPKDDAEESKHSETSAKLVDFNEFDQDRGETRRQNAPMLFDPKSGSMVAAKKHEPKTVKQRAKKQKTKESKGNGATQTTAANETSSLRGTNIDKKKVPKKQSLPARKFPRTCGVKYARGPKGNLYCSDGCEADLGYGLHSVPGGRVNNAEAYRTFVELHNSGTGGEGYRQFEENYDAIGLQTGYNIEEDSSADPDPVEWVKADDKIELIVGVDSPTLKPTAREFAPSQAALNAAAAVSTKASAGNESGSKTLSGTSTNGSVDDVTDKGDFLDDDEPNVGLGFDPTLDMDFVLGSSPVHGPLGKNVTDRFTSLALGDHGDSANRSVPRNLFAFGSSSAWTSESQEGNNGTGDWGAPASSSQLFGSSLFTSSADSKNSANPFLGMSDTNTWGTASKPAG